MESHHCKTILETFYNVKLSDETPYDVLNAFIDKTQTLVSNIETELKVLIPYSSSVRFDQIPTTIRKQYEEAKKKAQTSILNNSINKETTQDLARIKKLKEEIEGLQRVISSLKEDNKSLTDRNKRLRESVDKLTIFNNELEKTASNLKERAQSLEIKLNSQIDTNNMLKNVIHQRDEQYEKRTQQILRNERERHDNDLKRAHDIFTKQKSIYESKITRLMEKLMQTQKRSDELSQHYEQTLAKHQANTSLIEQQMQNNFNIKILGQILDQCFNIKGEWNNLKVAKAVQALVQRVHSLEREKKINSQLI